jgi:hypothetical protein
MSAPTTVWNLKACPETMARGGYSSTLTKEERPSTRSVRCAAVGVCVRVCVRARARARVVAVHERNARHAELRCFVYLSERLNNSAALRCVRCIVTQRHTQLTAHRSPPLPPTLPLPPPPPPPPTTTTTTTTQQRPSSSSSTSTPTITSTPPTTTTTTTGHSDDSWSSRHIAQLCALW